MYSVFSPTLMTLSYYNETLESDTKRHELYLAGKLNTRSGDKILDCGCGIGEPMRNIAKRTGAGIYGVTSNEVY